MTSHIIMQGDAWELAKRMPSKSVQCIVTSPPFFGLRDYGTATWEGGDPECDHAIGRTMGNANKGAVRTVLDTDISSCSKCGAKRIDAQFGLEQTPDEYVDKLVALFRELRRVLRDDGTLWLNLGDSYNGSGGSTTTTNFGKQYDGKTGSFTAQPRHYSGLKPKDLVGIPWRVAFALQADGWTLRSDIIWQKPNPMPESVTDRPTKAHEYIFLLSKSQRYFYDAEAVREEGATYTRKAGGYLDKGSGIGEGTGGIDGRRALGFRTRDVTTVGRNRRTVWTVTTKPYKGAHFACVDEDTECLTLAGWKKYSELQRGELLASYDIPSGMLRYEPMNDLAVYDYDGELHQLGGSGLGVLCTPNHRCIVKTRAGNVRINRADALVGGLSVPCAAEWDSGTFGFPNDPGAVVAELIGWAVTEGTFNDTSIRITQSITVNPDKVKRIESLLDQSGFRYKKHIRTRQTHNLPNGGVLGPRTYANFSIIGQGERIIKSFCGAEKIPLWNCALWSKESIWGFLEGVRLGDGHTRADGRVAIIQKSKAFLDMVQYLYLRLGIRTTVSRRPVRSGEMWTLYVRKLNWHSLRGTNGRGAVLRKVGYVGKVWCPSLPSGTFVARRNGRIWITGNTYPPALITPCILAGTSEVGNCPDCGNPWKRVVEKPQPPDEMRNRTDDTKMSFHTRSVGGGQKLQDWYNEHPATTIGWQPTCECGKSPIPAVVLDPFAGSGTTLAVALQHGRHAVGFELNPEYIELAEKRIAEAVEEVTVKEAPPLEVQLNDLPLFQERN